jgi:hypothetical protein
VEPDAEQPGQGNLPRPPFTEVQISQIASGFGCRSIRISSYDQLAATLADELPELARLSRPLVLDVVTNQRA